MDIHLSVKEIEIAAGFKNISELIKQLDELLCTYITIFMLLRIIKMHKVLKESCCYDTCFN